MDVSRFAPICVYTTPEINFCNKYCNFITPVIASLYSMFKKKMQTYFLKAGMRIFSRNAVIQKMYIKLIGLLLNFDVKLLYVRSGKFAWISRKVKCCPFIRYLKESFLPSLSNASYALQAHAQYVLCPYVAYSLPRFRQFTV